jgi:hypothetical protein
MDSTQATRLEAAALATDALTAHLTELYRQGDRMTFGQARALCEQLALGPFNRSELERIERDAARRASAHILGAGPDGGDKSRNSPSRGRLSARDSAAEQPGDPVEKIEALQRSIEIMKADLILALAFLPAGPVKSRLIEDYLGVPPQAQRFERSAPASAALFPRVMPRSCGGACTCA